MPLSIAIEVALTAIFLPSAVSIVTPPAPGRSLSVTVAVSVLRTFICGSAIEAGHSPTPQKQPLQIGDSVLPPSNSTQTLAPTGGSAKNPTPGPANGVQGRAQTVALPSAAGAVTCTRPIISGSMLSVTLPRYLPKSSFT